MSPHFFYSDFVFGEVPKISDVCHILPEVLFMLDVTHLAKLMLKQSSVWYHWILLVHQI